MIKPICFPFSCLSDKEREAIGAFFDQVAVFRTFEPEQPSPGMQVIVPVRGGEDHVKAFLREYSSFAAFNMEKASAFMKSANHKPLYDPTWSSELRSEIVRFMDDHGDQDDGADEEKAQSLLWARAFLEIAHEYDENNRSIDAELDTVARREKQLFETLMGGDRDESGELPFPGDTVQGDGSDIRIRHRLAAWATLFVAAWPDRNKTGDGFFVTTRTAVIEELEEFVPGFRHICDMTIDEMTKEALGEQVELLVTRPFTPDEHIGEQIDPKRKNIVLSLYLVENMSPFDCFSGILSRDAADSGDSATEIKNTVVGLIRY